jgi:hypothetical protein
MAERYYYTFDFVYSRKMCFCSGVWPFLLFNVSTLAKVICHSTVWKDGKSPAKWSHNKYIEQS